MREPSTSTTDPEAKVMKMADGGFRPADNAQFAADNRSGAVAGVSVDYTGSDKGRMAPMNEALTVACWPEILRLQTGRASRRRRLRRAR